MKGYLKTYFPLTVLVLGALLLIGAVSCEKRAEYERPLGLLSRLTKLTAEAGDTPVLVYSNTDWSAALTSKVSWAGLDRLSGSGCSQVHFQYAENYGRARKVGIAFEAGGVRDTVYMLQAAGQTDPVLQFTVSAAAVPSAGGVQTFALKSNLYYDITDVKAEINYESESQTGWLTVDSVSLDNVVCTVAANAGGVERSADLVLTHTDAAGESISTWIKLTQPAS